ncbi:unnamed protein product [Acanthoscelides obtectus]|uniref:RIIa domain-containing protein n=1 Tax=Acanthoscelides obtectus TaxID=200917 RepID=A0A9P0MDX4_ACAOB|nr:unnamed protein product [Acanthoscelides obtectus]CAK1635847.1 Sperm surface protein Sp17 [Acanthoscelides obtectus]
METETAEMIVKRVSVPIGLEELMEGLTKEVLLNKPDDLYEFAARYFSKLLLLRDKANYKEAHKQSRNQIEDQSEHHTVQLLGRCPDNSA